MREWETKLSNYSKSKLRVLYIMMGVRVQEALRFTQVKVGVEKSLQTSDALGKTNHMMRVLLAA